MIEEAEVQAAGGSCFISCKLPLVPSGLLFGDNCHALGWRYDALLCEDRQVARKAALVKKAIV